MSTIHHTPGRVRFKFSELKNQPRLAGAVERSIRGLNGIKLVQTNMITGSLLIHYEPRGEQEKALLFTIGQIHRHFGLTSAAKIESIVDAKPRNAPCAHADTWVDAFVGMVIEKVLQRSAMALVGALL